MLECGREALPLRQLPFKFFADGVQSSVSSSVVTTLNTGVRGLVKAAVWKLLPLVCNSRP